MRNKYVSKWVDKNGEYLTYSNYKIHFKRAKDLNIPLEDYFKTLGFSCRFSVGEHQTPWNNSAKLVSWVFLGSDDLSLLTLWKYKMYIRESKLKGVSIQTHLRSKGYAPLSDIYGSDYTKWFHIPTRTLLKRADYVRLMSKSDSEGIVSLLYKLGYQKLLDSKKVGFHDI